MSDPAYVYVIYIRTTPQKLWAALTDPELRAKFWYGRRCEGDWTAGSRHALWAPDGSLDFDGEVLESDPPRKLVYTFHNGPTWPEERAEGPSRVTYLIEPFAGDTVRFTMTHDGFPDGSKVREGVSGGWPAILSALKSLLETGEATPQSGG